MADQDLRPTAVAPVAMLPNQPPGWLADIELPPELVTGHQVIDAEHRVLLSSISGLRRICADQASRPHCGHCDNAARHHCESQLVAMLGDVLSFILDHFKTEEAIMRDSLMRLVDRELCEAHVEDHAAISSKVQQIIAALDPMNSVALIRELDVLLSRWIVNHISLHDVLLVRWVQREDSVLRQFSPKAP